MLLHERGWATLCYKLYVLWRCEAYRINQKSCYLTGIQLKNIKETGKLETSKLVIKLPSFQCSLPQLLTRSNLLLFKNFKTSIITYPILKTLQTRYSLILQSSMLPTALLSRKQMITQKSLICPHFLNGSETASSSISAMTFDPLLSIYPIFQLCH